MIKFIMKAPLSDLALKFVDFLVLNDVTKQEEVLGFFCWEILLYLLLQRTT